jgi:hypothetical protein
MLIGLLCVESYCERIGHASQWLLSTSLEPVGVNISARRSVIGDLVDVLETHESSRFHASIVRQCFVVGAHSVYLAFEVYVVEVHVGAGYA